MGAPARPAEELCEAEDLFDDGPQPSEEELAAIEAAWEREVLWRAKEHAEGRAKSVPWEEVRAELFGVPGPGPRR